MAQETNTFFETLYNAQYDFFERKGLNFFLSEVRNSNYSYVSSSFTMYIADTIEAVQQSTKVQSKAQHFPITSKEDFVKLSLEHRNRYHLFPEMSPALNKTIPLEFFNYFYKTYPKEQKDLVKEFYSFFPDDQRYDFPFWKNLITTLEYLKNNGINNEDHSSKGSNNFTKKDIAQFIHNFSISNFTASDSTPEQLSSMLEDNDFSKEEINSIFLKFYKPRLNQIKDPKFAPKLRDYLLKRFDYKEENLKQYFSFFPFLESHFKVSSISVFEETAPHSVTTIINYKKMVKAFSLDGWDISLYKNSFLQFLGGLKIYHKLGKHFISTESRALGTDRITIFYDNEAFNKTIFENFVTEFYHSLYDNPNVTVNKEFVNSWFSKRTLEQSLKEDKEIVKKKKI